MKCPICGRESWRRILAGANFSIEECSAGCIARTVPTPQFVPDFPDDASLEKLRDDRDWGHFWLASEILDLAGKSRPCGRLLDVGSGWGHLLKLAADRGYEVVGLEASPKVAELCHQAFGVDVIVGSFPEYEFESNTFDVMVMSHILEHLADPVRALSEGRRILKPGGLLIVCGPNFRSLMSRVQRDRWVGLQPDQHTWQLSVKSVWRMVGASGLTPFTVCHRHFDPGRGPRSLPKHVVRRAAYGIAELLGMGENMIVLARKA